MTMGTYAEPPARATGVASDTKGVSGSARWSAGVRSSSLHCRVDGAGHRSPELTP
jgi:hypothetical protein